MIVGVTWTKEQKQVIELRNRNLLVSAAAGSGKTAVLVERIVSKVLDREHPVDIDRMLIVTFTKAAAAEMRERVGQAIESRMEQDPDHPGLQRQYTLVHNAQITTIDSFCLYVVRNYFQTIGLETSFRIADPGELKLLKADVAKEVMEQHYQRKEEGFLQLADRYASAKSDSALSDFMLRLYDFSQSYPWPQEWLASLASHYHLENLEQLNAQPWMQGLLRYLGNIISDLKKQMEYAKALCEDDDGPQMYLAAVMDDLALLEELESCSSYEQYGGCIGRLKFSKLGVNRKYEGSADKQEQVKSLRKVMKDTLGRLSSSYFYQDSAHMLEDLHKILPDVEALAELAQAFSEAFQEKKAERNLLDFSDIEHFALKILIDEQTKEPTAAARELREIYEEIMIDEYQDSNYVQETILRAVSREEIGQNNIFMVGDVKQSIYRFRLARPELFIEKYRTYTAQESTKQKIDLHQNFRSRREVIESVNQIFYQIMHEDLGNVEYDEQAALYAGAVYPQPDEMYNETASGQCSQDQSGEQQEKNCGNSEQMYRTEDQSGEQQEKNCGNSGRMYRTEDQSDEQQREKNSRNSGRMDITEDQSGELKQENNSTAAVFRSELLLAQASEEELAEAGIEHLQEMEARMAAARIRELIDVKQPVTDKQTGSLRPARYRDIVILLRSITGWADIFLKVFTESGIPAHTTSQTGYFGTVEIQTILSMLSILDNPLQDIPLAAVLASPIGGFTSEELARIKTFSKEHFFYLALLEYMQYADQPKEEGTRQKAEEFLQTYEKLRGFTAYMPIHQLIQIVLQETGYMSYIQAMPAGAQRRANVDMLLEKAIAYEKSSYKGLFHFVRYIEKLKKYEVDFGEADLTSENEDVVRIMSIHKSKGLEFPIVLVCGMGKQFNRQDVRSRLILHPEYGIGLDVIDAERRVRKPGFIKKVLENEISIENQGEELRVLYVALTRAREKLIMTAAVKDLKDLNELNEDKPMDAAAADRDEIMGYFDRFHASSYLDWINPIVSHDRLNLYDKRVYHTQQLQLQEAVEEAEQRLDFMQLRQLYKTADETLYKQMDQRLSWSYPYEGDTDLKTKISVSELKHRTMPVFDEEMLPQEEWFDKEINEMNENEAFDKERESLIPAFMRTDENPENRSALRGSAVHKVMEEVDFTRSVLSEDRVADLCSQMEHMLAENHITQEMKELVSPYMIGRFLESPMAARMAMAQKDGTLHKEQPFVMGIPASRVCETASEELVLIQGIVDVYWEEDGELVILDYKTDAVKEPEKLIERYAVQLDLYGEALEKATGKKVKEKVIYSFSMQKEVYIE